MSIDDGKLTTQDRVTLALLCIAVFLLACAIVASGVLVVLWHQFLATPLWGELAISGGLMFLLGIFTARGGRRC
jgi:hypothetical protein